METVLTKQPSLDQAQVQANREMVVSELEALSMTLNEQELQVKGSADTGFELVLSRRPSKQEWKDSDFSYLTINVLPQLA